MLFKNRPNNGKVSYFIKNETDQNMSDTSPEQVLCPVNFTEIKKYQEKLKNLTIELTALQLFIKEQF